MRTLLTPPPRLRAPLLALTLLAATLPHAADAQSDSTFNNADWVTVVIPPTGSPGSTSVPAPTAPAAQDTTNGNSAPSRTTEHKYQGVVPPGIWAAHLYQPPSAFYNPSAQGAIAGLSYSYDLRQYTGGNQAVSYALLVYQNGAYYRSNSSPADWVYTSPSWQNFPATTATPKTLTAADFVKISGPASSPATPDFSCRGGVIQFGYATGNSNTGDTKSGIDNWRVNIVKGQPCCGSIAKPELRCATGGAFTYTFDVTNGAAGQAMQYLLLSPPPGAAYTVSPNVLNAPLGPGQTTPVSVSIANASPGDNVCVDVTLSDKAFNSCCKLRTCTRAPECPCLTRLKETAECGNGGSYTYTVQLQNQTGSPVQQIFVIPTLPAGATVAPQMFPVSLAIGATTTLQVTVSGVPPGSKVCLRLAPGGLESRCCSSEVCFTVPGQGQC